MAINKVKVSDRPKVGNIGDFEVLGVDKATGKSAKADMEQLRGNVGPKGDRGDTMFATFDIDPVTGELAVTTPDGYNGAQFLIEDDNLTVEI